MSLSFSLCLHLKYAKHNVKLTYTLKATQQMWYYTACDIAITQCSRALQFSKEQAKLLREARWGGSAIKGCCVSSHLFDLLFKVCIIVVWNHLRESDLLCGSLFEEEWNNNWISNDHKICIHVKLQRMDLYWDIHKSQGPVDSQKSLSSDTTQQIICLDCNLKMVTSYQKLGILTILTQHCVKYIQRYICHRLSLAGSICSRREVEIMHLKTQFQRRIKLQKEKFHGKL